MSKSGHLTQSGQAIYDQYNRRVVQYSKTPTLIRDPYHRGPQRKACQKHQHLLFAYTEELTFPLRIRASPHSPTQVSLEYKKQ